MVTFSSSTQHSPATVLFWIRRRRLGSFLETHCEDDPDPCGGTLPYSLPTAAPLCPSLECGSVSLNQSIFVILLFFRVCSPDHLESNRDQSPGFLVQLGEYLTLLIHLWTQRYHLLVCLRKGSVGEGGHMAVLLLLFCVRRVRTF